MTCLSYILIGPSWLGDIGAPPVAQLHAQLFEQSKCSINHCIFLKFHSTLIFQLFLGISLGMAELFASLVIMTSWAIPGYWSESLLLTLDSSLPAAFMVWNWRWGLPLELTHGLVSHSYSRFYGAVRLLGNITWFLLRIQATHQVGPFIC